MSLRDSAVELARRGFYVFRLRPNAKFPAFKGWQSEATNDPAKVRELWTVAGTEMQYNIGVALQPGMFAFDEDVSNGKRGDQSRELLEAIYDPLPATFTVRSARGGHHRYMTSTLPMGNSASKVGKHIDIKAVGGFAVGPGSVTDDGEYTIVLDAPIAPAPAWLAEMAAAKRERKTNDGAPLVEDLDTESAKVRAIEYLTGRAPDHGTFTVAAHVKDLGISAPTCFELMMDHWPPAEAKGDEHVLFRVENAYRYGQNAPGISSPEAEFDAVEIDQTKEPPKRGKLFFLPWAETKIEAERPYLIDGVLETGSMIVIYGDSNTGKTFVALDQAYHIAAGKDWNGHKVKQGAVVYVASEGGPGFAKRVEALKKRHGGQDVPFFTVPCLVDLYSETGSTGPLVKLVREVEVIAGPVVLVVVDTLARAMGGGDENTSTDMGKFVANCDKIRAATGAALNVVHHTGKDKAKGARGSSALRAATDTEIEIAPGSLTMTKQRDAGKFEGLKFKLDTLEVGRREDGQAITSCVVEWLSVNEFSDEVSPLAEQMLAVLERLVAAKRDEITEDEEIDEIEKIDKLEAVAVPWKEWENAALAVLTGARGKRLSRTALYPLRQELSDCQKAKKTKQNQWHV